MTEQGHVFRKARTSFQSKKKKRKKKVIIIIIEMLGEGANDQFKNHIQVMTQTAKISK